MTTVHLTQSTTKKQDKAYTYWVLQWRDAMGKHRSRTIGNVKNMSKRQAEKAKREKELEFGIHPGRSNISRSPFLGDYLKTYLSNRKSELAAATLELHKMTGRYLTAYFNKDHRLDTIQRPDARAFKAALARGDLAHIGHKEILSEASIHQHIRNANTIFGTALDDDILPFNPFNRIAGKTGPLKAWYEVSGGEFDKLYDASSPEWQLLFALCMHGALRRGEALNLPWNQIDWERSRMTIIASDEWKPKDRDYRVVPVIPELRSILLEAFDNAEPGKDLIIPAGVIKPKDTSKHFTRLCNKAGIYRWEKPCHTLRKTRLTRWAREFPQHVVSEWAGHSEITTTDKYYLKVSASEYDKAAGLISNEKQEAGIF